MLVGTIQNLVLSNVNVTNTYDVATSDSYTGAIAGESYGTIKNIGIQSGSVTGIKTTVNTTNAWPAPRTGGMLRNELWNCCKLLQ